MARYIPETEYVGDTEVEDAVFYNDYDIVKDLPDFDANNKLQRIKFWHEPGVRITGLELTYINPQTKDRTCPGAHISSDFDDDRMIAEVLDLELEEYVEEVRGFEDGVVNSLLLRTSQGKYMEVGHLGQGQAFKFRISKGYLVHSFTIGLGSKLNFLGLVTMPVTAMPRVQVSKPVTGLSSQLRPTIVDRSEYLGAQFEDALVVDDFFTYHVQHHLKRNRFRLISVECAFSDHIQGLNVCYLVKKEKKFSSYNFTYTLQQSHATPLSKDKLELDEDEWIKGVSGFAFKAHISQLVLSTNKGRVLSWGQVEKKATPFQFEVPEEKMVLALRGAYNTSGLVALMVYFVDVVRDKHIRIIE